MPSRLVLIAILGSLIPGLCHAREDAHARVEANARHAAASPGQWTEVLLTFEIDPGWHLYWDGKNDSGLAIEPSIASPEYLETGELMWPAPERKVSAGDILDHVYHDRVSLLWPIRIPEDAPVWTPLTIDIRVDWLACDDVCVLESGSATLTIPIAAPGDERLAEAEILSRFKAASALIPEQIDRGTPEFWYTWTGSELVFTAEEADGMRFFPKADCPDLADPIEGAVSVGGRLGIRFESAPEDEPVVGVVEVDRGNSRDWYEVSIEPHASTTPRD